ncbi:HAMP domain-containing sensor histidine kinase [Herbiconiux sp. L3-i23]|uniref:sensor histidine kinase n=1 Tax=Herbiconiux sp. L3-i23 TaxID=2905871 RepID=UPI00206AFF16|nr:HAMP domain-containing sensor histidine kinase [Herbiconiux sp. L3-i23]BDI21785.1 two-component sensor histidine kinase [Herbiconiux sp. L3-i23]
MSLRVQLTLSYAAFTGVVGVAIFAIGFLLLRFVPDSNLDLSGGFSPSRSDLTEVFVKYAVWALVALAVIGLVGGWILAGRMLTPLTRVTDAARLVRDGSLDHRIRMPGAGNELTDLADTFDDMVARVQASVEEQRRFAANASHELRTPHAVIRTMLEVAQADPDGRDVDALLRRIAEMNERSIVLTEALLDLARADARNRLTEVVDLAAVVGRVVEGFAADASKRDIRVSADLDAAAVVGDETLLRQLVTNLVQNAVAHTPASGEVWVSVARARDGVAALSVANTGPALDAATAATFVEPFVRGAGRARRRGDEHVGSGLGLAIVASIARAHDASLEIAPRDGGGLRVRVTFPPRG